MERISETISDDVRTAIVEAATSLSKVSFLRTRAIVTVAAAATRPLVAALVELDARVGMLERLLLDSVEDGVDVREDGPSLPPRDQVADRLERMAKEIREG